MTARVRLVLGLLLGAATIVPAACRPTAPPKPNVVLIVIDTLRADHLGVYGYQRPTSPNIDALARKGTTFTAAHSTTSWTLPSVVSILTGLYPVRHGVERNVSTLGPETPTLAEAYAAAGYETLAISANIAFVTPQTGIGRGFQRFDVLPSPPPTDPPAPDQAPGDAHFTSFVRVPTADKVTDAALEWLEQRPPQHSPFFLYVHYFDPHAGYFPPAAYAEKFGVPPDEPLAGPQQWRLWNKQQIPGAATQDELRVLTSLYDAEIAFTDTEVGRLLDRVTEAMKDEPLVVVLTADHGEELGDHGALQHGQTLWEEVLHVPLIIAGTGVAAGRLDTPVSLVSLWPTLAELTRIAPPPAADGPSLFADLRTPGVPTAGRVAADLEPVFPGYRHVHHHALIDGPWKLLVRPDKSAELYNLQSDPAERQDVARTEVARASMLKTLSRVRANMAAVPRPVASGHELTPEQRARLRALGYSN